MCFQPAPRPACGRVSGAVTMGGACGVRTSARLRPLSPWNKAPDGLPGGGLRAFFRREAPGAGAGRRMVWKGSGWRLSELGATGSGAVGGA